MKWDLDVFELTILILAGTIRGAVAFALILIMTGENAALLQVTTYINLMVSTIVMGAIMPHLIKIIMKYRDKVYPDRAFHNQNEISDLIIEQRTQSLLPHMHKTTVKSNVFHKKWRNIDDEYLKPFFIHNYKDVKVEIEYQHRLSVNEIYKVEFNNNYFDIRNPLPYAIKELDITEIKNKKAYSPKNKERPYSVTHEKDVNLSLEQQLDKGKSDFEVNYKKRESSNTQVFNYNDESLGSPPKYNEESLNKNLIREKLRNKMLLKGKKKQTKKKGGESDMSINSNSIEEGKEKK